MSNNSKREDLIKQYRQITKEIRDESDENRRNELKIKASEINDLITIEDFDNDKNIGRFRTV